MDGLLVLDKPAGPSSHDAVVRVRRLFGERRIGHTGTLDPAATGVLPLVIGRATRLARFLAAGNKSYEAVVRLGVRTTTADAQGDRVGPDHVGPFPSADAVEAALDSFRGTFLQQPPAYSAKKIAGKRSYELARGEGPPALPRPVQVTAHAIRLLDAADETIRLSLDCSAGFYVRSLAADLGERLGTGAHLVSLRRTRSAEFTLADAIGLEVAERDPADAARRVIPISRLLVPLHAVVLTGDGVRRAAQGRELAPPHWAPASGDPLAEAPGHAVRLLDERGELVGIARPAGTTGLLHPFVVLV